MDLREATVDNGHRHPWELARRDSVLRLLAGTARWNDVADVGAGDRFVAAALRAAAAGRVYAIDVHYEETGLADGIQTGRAVDDLPDAGLDLVVMMDVLEHVDDEGPLLDHVRRKLRPGGMLLVTVPAFQRLFSAHDSFLRHFRRYHMRQLRDVLERHGFRVEETFYFYASLFLVRSLQVAVARLAGAPPQSGVAAWRFGMRHPVTIAARALLDWDYRMCRRLTRLGVTVPGLSLCAVCRIASA
jgi:SAM-dependent methyltransferase